MADVGAVAPFVGAWIEITNLRCIKTANRVAPFVGAWIEIQPSHRESISAWSLRSSERGLKCKRLTGYIIMLGRSVRRSVD